MKVIGYGICGPGEANRYMRSTLEEFKRLCDEVVILCNNSNKEEHDLIDEFGFKRVHDRREWGRFQWRIKQDFVQREIKQIAADGDMIVCLDMDEVFSPELTKEWLKAAPFDAYHVFVVDLWNDPEHFKLDSCFWNVRIWRWGNTDLNFKPKPVHCGLAPEWTYHYHRHAPFILKHYGLMDPEDRVKKVARYQKYDPHAEHLDRRFYDMLKDDSARPFDEAAMQKQVAEEVESYKETKPTKDMTKTPQGERYAYVRNPHGEVIDIPEKHLQMTMKRKGFEFINWADEQDKEIDAMFAEDDEEVPESTGVFVPPHAEGAYQRSTADEKAEVDGRNAKDDNSIKDSDVEGLMDVGTKDADELDAAVRRLRPELRKGPENEHPKPDPNVTKKTAKKVAKKTTKKK